MQNKGAQFVFVGSAGAYEADPIEPLLVEGDKRKSSAGHVAVEQFLVESGVPFTVIQPQYIYGPFTAKDCEQWFIDRIIRDRPVPIPGAGIQLTNLTHVEDVASLLAKVRKNQAAMVALLGCALDVFHVSSNRRSGVIVVKSNHLARLMTVRSLWCMNRD